MDFSDHQQLLASIASPTSIGFRSSDFSIELIDGKTSSNQDILVLLTINISEATQDWFKVQLLNDTIGVLEDRCRRSGKCSLFVEAQKDAVVGEILKARGYTSPESSIRPILCKAI